MHQPLGVEFQATISFLVVSDGVSEDEVRDKCEFVFANTTRNQSPLGRPPRPWWWGTGLDCGLAILAPDIFEESSKLIQLIRGKADLTPVSQMIKRAALALEFVV